MRRPWIPIVLLPGAALTVRAMKHNPKHCPPTGKGYAVTYTIVYDFGAGEEMRWIEYRDLCSCEVSQSE